MTKSDLFQPKTLVLAWILVMLCFSGCTNPVMEKAKTDARNNPDLCKKSLAEGALVISHAFLPSDEWNYRYTLYNECLASAIKKNPEICIEVLAAGKPSGPKGFVTTQPEAQAITEYFYCKYVGEPRLRSGITSRLNLERVGVNQITEAELSGAKIGRISSVQLENISTPGTRSGASLGAAVGQVAYLEKYSGSDYNAWSQLGAGIVGSSVGSALDESPSVQFKITYWIKKNDGEFLPVRLISNVSGHLPEGMCVALIGSNVLKQAPETKCTQ